VTSLLDGAKRRVSRGSDLGDRVEALGRASESARGRLDDRVVDDAEATVDRVARRLSLTADHTVVAIGGATGSGKSSTFNALAGVEKKQLKNRRKLPHLMTGVICFNVM